jgi:hypothetical protein
MIRGVLFDVDLTLIRPGPMFRAEGYQAFWTRYGIAVDSSIFDFAVASAAPLLDGPEDALYDDVPAALERLKRPDSIAVEALGVGTIRLSRAARTVV